jgi:hypothetical protein
MVTQNDVRAIQLAKAALYAGIKLLMDKQGIDHVDRIGLAGAFGSFIDPKYALVLGLVPDCDLSKVKAVGNAAGTGARMALLNRTHRREIEATVTRIEKIETALETEIPGAFRQRHGAAQQDRRLPPARRSGDAPGALNGHRACPLGRRPRGRGAIRQDRRHLPRTAGPLRRDRRDFRLSGLADLGRRHAARAGRRASSPFRSASGDCCSRAWRWAPASPCGRPPCPGSNGCWRAACIEGLSHLAIVVSAPTLIAQLSTVTRHQGKALTLWGTYFGVAFAGVALTAPFVMHSVSGLAGLPALHAAVYGALRRPSDLSFCLQ